MAKNVPPELEDKFRACKEKVIAGGESEEAAYGICYMSVVEGKSLDEAFTKWAEDYLKRGARNSKKDAARLQTIHDYAAENGAMCGEGKSFELPEEMFINFGTEAKSLKTPDVKDFAIVYDGEDLPGDYFMKDTEYGFAGASTKRVPILFNHAQPLETKGKHGYVERAPIGEAELEITDEGVLIKEAILYNRAKYEAYLDNLGWSTGAASHAVLRETQPDGRNKIKQWLLSELSVTPMSAEPRIRNVIALKSIPAEAVITDKDGTNQTKLENIEMEKEEFKTMLDASRDETVKLVEAKAAEAAEKAVKDFADKLPEIKGGFNVQVTHDEADNEFKSVGEQMLAVKSLAKGGQADPRLKRLSELNVADGMKAPLGLNEGVPSQGQYLLEPTLSAEIFKPIHEAGVFSSKVRTLPVGANSNYGWINGIDETSRADGSRWGGVRGYWRAEAGTTTATKPKFRRINWELHALEVLMYATDEALQDAAMISAIVSQSAGEELNFKVNDAILNGDGVGKPQGVLNAGALISVGRYTASQINHVDILNMWQRVHPAFRGGLAWFINSEVEPQLDKLAFTSNAATTEMMSPYVTYGPDGVMRIKGKQVFVTEFNAALGTAGDILLADFSQYLLWQKGGVQSSVNPWLQWLTGEEAFKFTARVDGQSAYASAITPYKGTNTQSPFVCLASTTG